MIDRVVAVEFCAEDFIVEPEVFADADRSARAGDVDDLRRAPRLEVAQLVENVVSRKKNFVLLKDDSSVLREDGSVVQRLSAPRLISCDAAEQQRRFAGHLRERIANFERLVDENLAIQKIARRIAGDRQLRYHDQIRARPHALLVRVRNQLSIRADRPDRGVELSNKNLHPALTIDAKTASYP